MNTGTILDIAMHHSDKIILRAQQGDRDAFNKLVSLWYKRIYNFAHKYFNDHDLASEIAQKTFISLYQNLTSMRDMTRFKSWIYTIALNKCREEERMSGRRAKVIVISKDGEEQSAQVHDDQQNRPDQTVIRKELSELLLAVLAQLADEQREVIIMKEYEGLKFREIAEILGISENTVKSRLYYGFKHLKKILEQKEEYKEIIRHET